MPIPTRHVRFRLFAAFAVWLALLVPGMADAVSMQRLQGKPFAVTLDCRATPAADRQQVRIEAPPEGWPAWGQSVLVLDAPPGLVTFRRGDEVLVTAKVKLACFAGGRAVRIPEGLRKAIGG